MDEDAWRSHIMTTLKHAENCSLEFTIRDVYTIHHDVDKAKRCVAVLTKEINNTFISKYSVDKQMK